MCIWKRQRSRHVRVVLAIVWSVGIVGSCWHKVGRHWECGNWWNHACKWLLLLSFLLTLPLSSLIRAILILLPPIVLPIVTGFLVLRSKLSSPVSFFFIILFSYTNPWKPARLVLLHNALRCFLEKSLFEFNWVKLITSLLDTLNKMSYHFRSLLRRPSTIWTRTSLIVSVLLSLACASLLRILLGEKTESALSSVDP